VPERRRAVGHAVCRGISQRRACALIGVARSTLHYESVLALQDAPVVALMKDLAAQYPRYGYRRIRIFLRRQGHAMSPDRCHRLWRQAGLQVPRRRPRRRVAGSRERPLPPAAKNHVWAYDFIFDACANGQKLKCLTIGDEYTRECLAIDVAGSIRSTRVLEQLAKLISIHGAPRYLRCDNGPEFVSKAILEWIIDAASTPRTSIQASPGRMAPMNPSTASFAMNACRWSGFDHAKRQRSSSRPGGGTTTRYARIPVSITKHRTSLKLS